ncbi:MAG: histidine ammonia-lyase, partial [Caldilineae bacterium]
METNLLNPIPLDGQHLTIDQVVAVAHGEPGEPRVVLDDDARRKVARAADAVQTLIARGEVAYGITTGFGAFKDRIIPPDEVTQL